MKVPDAIEPAVGYRVWYVRNNRLHSIAHEMLWEPGMPVEAECRMKKDHPVPDENCSCGTYATANFNNLFDMGYTRTQGPFAVQPGVVVVAGLVNLWGDIVPGTRGWRAQYAYPKKLLVPYSLYQYARPLAEAYGVPYKLFNLERKH
jgi:hypothetical protein